MLIVTYETIQGRISNEYRKLLRDIIYTPEGKQTLTFQKASNKLRNKLNNWTGDQCLMSLVSECYEDTTNIRFLISAPNESKFKNYCKKIIGHAGWGCCIGEAIAIEYSPTNSGIETLLHESLHLFGVNDCYHEDNLLPKSTCTNPHCLMRYGNTTTEVCRSVKEQIQNQALLKLKPKKAHKDQYYTQG